MSWLISASRPPSEQEEWLLLFVAAQCIFDTVRCWPFVDPLCCQRAKDADEVKAEADRSFTTGKAFKLVTYECSRAVITTANDIRAQSAEPPTWHSSAAPGMHQGQEQHYLQQESKAGISVGNVGLLGGRSPWPISLHKFLDD